MTKKPTSGNLFTERLIARTLEDALAGKLYTGSKEHKEQLERIGRSERTHSAEKPPASGIQQYRKHDRREHSPQPRHKGDWLREMMEERGLDAKTFGRMVGEELGTGYRAPGNTANAWRHFYTKSAEIEAAFLKLLQPSEEEKKDLSSLPMPRSQIATYRR